MNTDSLAVASPTFGNVATIPEEAEAESTIAIASAIVGTAATIPTAEENEEPKADWSSLIVLPGLPLDIQPIIFNRMPLKVRTSLKLVSKNWHDFIIGLGRGILISRCGLISCYPPPVPIQTPVSTQTYLMSVGGDGREVIDYSVNKYLGSFELVDSCKGMLLYYSDRHFLISALDRSCFMLRDYQLRLPYLKRRYTRGFLGNHTVRLLFDGGNSFKVLCHYWGRYGLGNTRTLYALFTSSKWKWREFGGIVLNPQFMVEPDFRPNEYGSSSVFQKGKAYSIWSTCMLIFYVERRKFELTKLPEHVGRKLLFECEGALKLSIMGDEKFNIYDYGGGTTWELKNCIRWENLHSDIPLFANRFTLEPLAFDDDFMLLYFQAIDVQTGEDGVFYYSFNSENLTRMRIVNEDTNYVPTFKAFLFNYVNLEEFGPRGQ